MTREDYIIRMRRAARERAEKSGQGSKKSLPAVIGAQILVCVIAFGAFMSVKNIENVNNCIKYYLNYTVDYQASVDGIIRACRSCFVAENDA